jgi:hypothetical protein
MWWMRSRGSAAILTQVLLRGKLLRFDCHPGHTKHLALAPVIPLTHGFAMCFSVAVT